jgi:hypothetical protein
MRLLVMLVVVVDVPRILGVLLHAGHRKRVVVRRLGVRRRH